MQNEQRVTEEYERRQTADGYSAAEHAVAARAGGRMDETQATRRFAEQFA